MKFFGIELINLKNFSYHAFLKEKAFQGIFGATIQRNFRFCTGGHKALLNGFESSLGFRKSFGGNL